MALSVIGPDMAQREDMAYVVLARTSIVKKQVVEAKDRGKGQNGLAHMQVAHKARIESCPLSLK